MLIPLVEFVFTVNGNCGSVIGIFYCVVLLVGELHMGSLGVEFLPSRANLCITFLRMLW